MEGAPGAAGPPRPPALQHLGHRPALDVARVLQVRTLDAAEALHHRAWPGRTQSPQAQRSGSPGPATERGSPSRTVGRAPPRLP